MVYWSKNYTQLPAGWYSAAVRTHGWPGHYLFVAYPSRGDWCTEYHSKSLAEVIGVAELWLAGLRYPGVYSASA